MRLIVFGLSACLAVGLIGLSPGLRADEKKKDEKTDQKKGDPEKEFQAIQKDYGEAQQAFFKAYQDAKTQEEKSKVLKEKRPNPAEYADRFLKLAETYPDSPAATQAYAWLFT